MDATAKKPHSLDGFVPSAPEILVGLAAQACSLDGFVPKS
uniref:Uncharacterized protein n=1 Tax=Arundo donax TaxID=35708 RepID=A0A0A9DPG6_ARUDO